MTIINSSSERLNNSLDRNNENNFSKKVTGFVSDTYSKTFNHLSSNAQIGVASRVKNFFLDSLSNVAETPFKIINEHKKASFFAFSSSIYLVFAICPATVPLTEIYAVIDILGSVFDIVEQLKKGELSLNAETLDVFADRMKSILKKLFSASAFAGLVFLSGPFSPVIAGIVAGRRLVDLSSSVVKKGELKRLSEGDLKDQVDSFEDVTRTLKEFSEGNISPKETLSLLAEQNEKRGESVLQGILNSEVKVSLEDDYVKIENDDVEEEFHLAQGIPFSEYEDEGISKSKMALENNVENKPQIKKDNNFEEEDDDVFYDAESDLS